MEIREATKKDVVGLSKLFQQEIEYLQSLAGYYELQPNYDWLAYTEIKLKDRNRQILLAEQGKNLCGFIYIRIVNYPPQKGHKSILQQIRNCAKKGKPLLPVKPLMWGLIEECYVLPSQRKQGIGSQLVFRAMKWFQSKKVSRIELSHLAKNKEGEAFWRKSGFETFRLSLSKKI